MIVKFLASILLATCLVTSASAQFSRDGQGPTLLLHGNYCGPGNNAPLAPIDALDAACARHDACTPAGGFPSKACNLRLQHDTKLISRDPREPKDVRDLAGFISAGAGLIASGQSTPFPLPVGLVGPRLGAPVFGSQ